MQAMLFSKSVCYVTIVYGKQIIMMMMMMMIIMMTMMMMIIIIITAMQREHLQDAIALT